MEENRLMEDVAKALENVRAQCPLIHNITNYVTVNDVANIVLAVGASPIMADDIAEAGDIASIAGALVLNIGTLNARTVESMVEAGKRANQAGVPVVLDPVGAGASALRNETTARLIKEVKLTVLRGNLSEISFIAGEQSNTKGVDAGEADADNDAVAIAKKVAKQLGCVVGITGQVDVVSDGTGGQDRKRREAAGQGHGHGLYDQRAGGQLLRGKPRCVYRDGSGHCHDGHGGGDLLQSPGRPWDGQLPYWDH